MGSLCIPFTELLSPQSGNVSDILTDKHNPLSIFMKKNIYITLAIIATALLGYTSYYAITHTQPAEPVVVATTTPTVASSTPKDTNTYTTKKGMTVTLTETNPVSESLSTITLTTTGFASTAPIVIEVNKMSNSWYADINGDTYEELIITTISQGLGGYGEALIFTTASTSALLPVVSPEISENDTKKGALFEGYVGHDSFNVVRGNLVREFPTYRTTDTNDTPTGPRKAVMYTLAEKNGMYFVSFATTTPSSMPEKTTTPVVQTASGTPQNRTASSTSPTQAR